jgi:hypothetical protein
MLESLRESLDSQCSLILPWIQSSIPDFSSSKKEGRISEYWIEEEKSGIEH